MPPFNGNGDFSLAPGNPVSTGAVVSSTWANDTLNDIASALDNVMCRDGQAAATAAFNMGGFRIQGLGAATGVGHAVIASQVQNNTMTLVGSVAGTNTITGTATPTPAAYASGQKFQFIPANTNTGATTLNVSSLGAKNIFVGGVACVGGEIRQNVPVEVIYDGTQFHVISTTHSVKGTFTATLTGVSGSVTTTAAYTVVNNVVTVNYLPMTGTSNTTACTITGQPAAIMPATAHNGFFCMTQDNSASAAGARADIGTDGVVTLFVNFTSATFTGSNVKGLIAGATFSYNLN